MAEGTPLSPIAERRFCVHCRGDRLHPGTFDRTRYVLVRLAQKLRALIESDLLPPGDCVLDYGCGTGAYRSLLAQRFKRYVGADLTGNTDAELTLTAEGRVPVEDGTFDCVLSSQVLEHVPDPQAYLREAYRVLKPEGHLILCTHGIWPYHPDPVDYWRWTIDGLQAELGRAGFEPLRVESVLGLASCALQLWQDATYERLPRAVQPYYIWVMQYAIGRIERRQADRVSSDASVYLVLARRDGGLENPPR